MLNHLISFTLYTFICNNISLESIEVQTTLGLIKGKYVDDKITGACYYSFEGIRYAEPPVGHLRFKAPVKIRPFTEIIDATKPGWVCPQPEGIYAKNEMHEDCLNFNIFTPANKNLTKSIPVIFVIHGGDFSYASGKTEPIYGPQLFILNDVVLVTVNYRLGALGFLSLCTEEIPGNAGFKDVLLALKIIHEIIGNFGGDCNKITIMGTGAGAALAELLMLTEQCKGLFQSVVLQSGSILSAEYMQLNPEKNAELLGLQLGIELLGVKVQLNVLKDVDPFDIIEAQVAIELKDPQRGFRLCKLFKPVVEIECSSAIITRPPKELMAEGAIVDVPMLIGFNNQEGLEIFPLLEKEPELIDKLNENFELLIPADIKYPLGSADRRTLAKQIKDFYFNGGNITFTKFQNYINLISDAHYTFSIDLFVELFIAKKKSSVYYYIFEGDTELNFFKILNDITCSGATHGDNLGYIFLTSIEKLQDQGLECNTKDKDIISIHTKIRTSILLSIKNFVYYGAPAPNPNLDCWPEAVKNRCHIIQNNEFYPVYHSPLPKRIGFWRKNYKKYYASKHNTDNICLLCLDGIVESILS